MLDASVPLARVFSPDDPYLLAASPPGQPCQIVESVQPVGGGRLAFVHDTNFGSMGRNPRLSDYSDLIVVRVPGPP